MRSPFNDNQVSYSIYVRTMPRTVGVLTTREVAPGVNIDYLDGEVYGVEVLSAYTVEVDGHDVIDRARRMWWWSAKSLTYRWRPFLLGGDEFGNRTVGIRLPGGMLIVALNVPLRTRLWDPELAPPV